MRVVERREGVNEVRTSTAHHARKVENQRIGERQFEEARLCRFSTSRCASREMLVKRKILFLPIA
jgi:hypothetical protein